MDVSIETQRILWDQIHIGPNIYYFNVLCFNHRPLLFELIRHSFHSSPQSFHGHFEITYYLCNYLQNNAISLKSHKRNLVTASPPLARIITASPQSAVKNGWFIKNCILFTCSVVPFWVYQKLETIWWAWMENPFFRIWFAQSLDSKISSAESGCCTHRQCKIDEKQFFVGILGSSNLHCDMRIWNGQLDIKTEIQFMLLHEIEITYYENNECNFH